MPKRESGRPAGKHDGKVTLKSKPSAAQTRCTRTGRSGSTSGTPLSVYAQELSAARFDALGCDDPANGLEDGIVARPRTAATKAKAKSKEASKMKARGQPAATSRRSPEMPQWVVQRLDNVAVKAMETEAQVAALQVTASDLARQLQEAEEELQALEDLKEPCEAERLAEVRAAELEGVAETRKAYIADLPRTVQQVVEAVTKHAITASGSPQPAKSESSIDLAKDELPASPAFAAERTCEGLQVPAVLVGAGRL
eukprot:TRINITY_DN122582_c0_g1_i1.p1 TRINITY_DN122582_c0_g1~~TRINITY_DN122582_c0_g1_i1.p1  ORF type:complete len:255 (-),score=57.11 TRINITY_DN122582_c0_g1_i1:453-1217(-)